MDTALIAAQSCAANFYNYRPTARFAELLGLFSGFSRADLECGAEVLIDLLDALDGDPDLSPNGDELDGCLAEDEHGAGDYGRRWGAGCEFSDPGGSNDNEDEDHDEGFLHRRASAG